MSQPYFKAGLYSHHFVLTQLTPNARGLVDSFARHYIQYGLVKAGRKFIREAVKVFGARTANYAEYRFHINQWNAFTKHLTNNGVAAHNYEVVLNEADPGEDVGIETLPQWQEHDYQIPIGEYLVSDKPTKIKLLEIQTGKGKLAPLDTKIKIPGGWTTMGDIREGQMVTAWDGTPAEVIGVFPQGEQDVYKVTFADGRYTFAGPEHLWKVYYINTVINRRWRVVDTMEMKRLISMPNPRVYVPLCKSEIGDDISVPLDPYVLGVILGDGGISNNSVIITKLDKDLFENVAARLPEDVELVRANFKSMRITGKNHGRNSIIKTLRTLNLMGLRSWEKFIPEHYLNGSTKQRLELLQGLMDTDGTSNTRETGGAISYNSTSHDLAKGVQYLVRSLGGIASISERNTQYTHKDELKDGRVSYDVNIRYHTPSEIFTIERKKSRTNDDNQYAKDLKLRVMSVEPAGRDQTQCISINHPDQLYITDDFIVTHNTFCAMKAAARLGKRMAIIIKPGYIDKWIEDVKKICGIERDDITVVQGSAQVMNLMARAEAGLITEKVIIFSNRTLQNLFSLYEERGRLMLEQGYAFYPHELFPKLKVGLRLIDEVHQDFHLNFKLDLYTHVAHSISLSATLKSDDAFMNRMYEMTYPREDRYAGLAYDKYVTAFSWMYSVRRPELLRASEHGSMTYSHHAFEKSVIRQPAVLDSFLDMVHTIVQRFYLADDYKPGDRCLVYCASIDMCTRVVDHLKALIKDKDIRRYVEDDPYENLMDAEICVSTLLSAGTGHDIAQLTTVILTTNVLSHQSNVQGFGRLRKIPNRKMRFIYTNCTDVPKHLEYHEKKRELLRMIALDYNTVTYGQVLG
jgi:intein/homing endonuclease